MSYIQFVVTLALALDAFWAGIGTSQPPPNKAAVKEWQSAVEAGYAEIGMDNNNLFPPIFSFENGSGWPGMPCCPYPSGAGERGFDSHQLHY